jgi:hypothetical protein
VAVRVAGRFVATLGVGGIDVYDLSSGLPIYGLHGQEVSGPTVGPGAPASFALNPDGSVVVASAHAKGKRFGYRIVWASPTEPSAHVLPLPIRGHYAVRWLGDQLLVTAGSSSAAAIADAMLLVVDRHGRTARVIARGIVDRSFSESFDSDGARITYVTRSCNGATIHLQNLRAPARTYVVARSCPLAFTKQPRVHAEQLTFTVSCRGSLALCQARNVKATTIDPAHPTRGAQAVGGRTLARAGGAVTVYLNGLGRRLMRAGRRLRVTLSADVGDLSIAPSELMAALHRRSTVTLVASR